MNTQYFFITGPPRSGTTWLANLFTNHDVICFHELGREKGSAEATIEALKSQQRPFVGDCGPFVKEYVDKLDHEFHGCKRVMLFEPDSGRPRISSLENDLWLESKSQFDEAIARRIWEHCCPGLPWDSDRFHILSQMRVTTLEERAALCIHPDLRRRVSRATQTPVHAKYYELLRQLCGQRIDAYQWSVQVLDLALTWDHLVDNDPVDVELAERTLEAISLQWPLNQFYREAGQFLAPVLSNCISAWRSGHRPSEYNIYTELPAAIAFLIGGSDWRDRVMPAIRRIVKEEIMADDLRDEQ